jgi:hypothetical protein
VFQLTMYCWPAASARIVSDPGPVVFVNRATTSDAAHVLAVPRQISTIGDGDASNVPVYRGAGTIGGRKKKCGLPRLAPSERSNDGARSGGSVIAEGTSWQPASRAAETIARASRRRER